MVVVPKTDGSVKICVDITQLNESVHWEHHPLLAVEQALVQLAEARVFSKLMPTPAFGRFLLQKTLLYSPHSLLH